MTTSGRVESVVMKEQEVRAPHGRYGARFMDRLRGQGASLGSLRRADLQQLRSADRKGLVRLLSRRHSVVPTRLVRAIREYEPEDLATALAHDRRMMWAFLLLARS